MTPPPGKKSTRRLLAALLAFEVLATPFGPLTEPARAQFFPFFDNRPETPPAAPRRHPIFRPTPKKPRIHPAPQHRAPTAKTRAEPKSEPKPPPPPPAEAPPPPYEPQLLRLAEIMGALAVLQNLCAAGGARNGSEDSAWRESMQNLMESQDAGPLRRERLAGAYNRGLRGYQYIYRQCTPSAELARSRFLDEGERLTHDIFVHYKEN